MKIFIKIRGQNQNSWFSAIDEKSRGLRIKYSTNLIQPIWFHSKLIPNFRIRSILGQILNILQSMEYEWMFVCPAVAKGVQCLAYAQRCQKLHHFCKSPFFISTSWDFRVFCNNFKELFHLQFWKIQMCLVLFWMSTVGR